MSLRATAVAVALLASGCLVIPIPTGGGSPPAGQPSSYGAGGGPSGPAAPAAPGAPRAPVGPAAPSVPTTVEIHSDCPSTVHVFYGDKPKYGSGTHSTISSNSTTSAGRKGDGTLKIWIVTEKEDPIASADVRPETRRVDIASSCTALVAK